MHDDVVIGGGPGGLATAFRLLGAGRDVCLLEATERVGGLVRTVERHGLLLEQGPETLQTTPEVVRLVEDLDLIHRVVGPSDAARLRFVLHDGALVALPMGLLPLLRTPLLTRAEVARLLLEPLVRSRAQGPETVAGFVTRRFGAGVARELVDPFVAGVFGGDPTALEVDSAFADLPALEAESGSVVRGAIARGRRKAPLPPWVPAGGMMTFRQGMTELVDALATHLGDTVRLHSPALSLTRTSAGWTVLTPDGPVVAKRVWLACPLAATARLLGDPAMTVPTAPLAAIHLAFRTEDVARAPQGFGWLAPSHARRDVLGCIWVSSLFPGHAPGHVLLRVMVGGARAPELVDLDDDALVTHARRVVAEVQGIDALPVVTDVASYPTGIPQYPLGHAARVAAWQARWPDLKVLGWGATGIGLSHAFRTAERAAAGTLTGVPVSAG